MIGRREFTVLLGRAAAAWPLAARAQPPSGRPLIGLLSPLSANAQIGGPLWGANRKTLHRQTAS